MSAYYTIFLLAFLVALAVLLVRYVNNSVDKEFRSLARAASDEEFRAGEIARLDALLKGRLPLPADVQPLPGPASGGRGALPPILMALGVILLWGAGAVQKGRMPWIYGGGAALLLATLIMLLTLKRRTWARTARQLLFRADLKRLAGDRAAAAADLRELLRLTPWDDSAWAELSDDLAAMGDLPGAMGAMEKASGVDPRYDEYRMLEASLAIRLGRLDRAREAIEAWAALDGVAEDDPRLAIYRAALQLAEGNRDSAASSLKKALLDEDAAGLKFLDTDQALAGVRDLLPGRA